KSEQVNHRFGNADAKAEPALITIFDQDRSPAQVGDALGPEPGVAGFIGEMLGHLELGIGVLEMVEQFVNEGVPSQFSIAVEAEDDDLPLYCGFSSEIH